MKKQAILNLPPCNLDVRPDADSKYGGSEVYDMLRRRWVALTPEEWVRQNFVAFLVGFRGFPPSLMTNELALRLNGTLRRADTIVYTQSLRPLAVVEYKATDVPITQKVFDQIARYNSVIGAAFLIVSNGLKHFCCRYSGSGYEFLSEIPTYGQMLEEVQNK